MNRRSVFSFFYDILFFLGVLLYLPFYFKKKKITFASLKEKCTFYSSKIKQILSAKRKTVWIQVVSVGEVTLIRSLIEYLKTQLGVEVVITVTTLTGRQVAEKKYPGCLVLYLPFDISLFIRRAIRLIKPAVFVAIETEIWPNLYLGLKKTNVPVVILNGRISEQAFKQYKKVKWLIGKVLNMTDYIGVQNEFYRDRFLALGADPQKIAITGNLKFSNYAVDEKKYAAFFEKYHSFLKPEDSLLFVAASTHGPEESYVLNCYKTLLSRYPHLRLMIVPRHIDRVTDIEKIVRDEGFSIMKLSEGFKGDPLQNNVFIVDTVGDLLACYYMADLCFVGGSLSDYGGHNILEPLYFAKPTLFGPYMSNFKEIEEIVLEGRAAIQVENAEQLCVQLDVLIRDVSLREQLRNNTHAIFQEGQEMLERSVACIRRWLP